MTSADLLREADEVIGFLVSRCAPAALRTGEWARVQALQAALSAAIPATAHTSLEVERAARAIERADVAKAERLGSLNRPEGLPKWEWSPLGPPGPPMEAAYFDARVRAIVCDALDRPNDRLSVLERALFPEGPGNADTISVLFRRLDKLDATFNRIFKALGHEA